MRGWKAFQNEETGKPQRALKASLKDSWVNARSIKLRPIDFKVPMRILGQTVLIRRTASAKINMVYLCNKTAESSCGHINLLAIICGSGSVDVEPGEDFTD